MKTKSGRRFITATMVAAATLLTMAANAQAAVVINEFWADDAYTISSQYVELYNTSASPVNLTGLSLLVVNGDTLDPNNPSPPLGGDPNSPLYGQVDLRVDFDPNSPLVMPAKGYYLIGSGLSPNPDRTFTLTYIGQGTATFALVNTSDIAYKDPPTNRHLSDASIAAITINKLDAVATRNSVYDSVYFNAYDLGSTGTGYSWDTASRMPDGDPWNATLYVQDNYTTPTELGDANDLLGTPGKQNGKTGDGTYDRILWGACCNGASCSYVQKTACLSPAVYNHDWRDCSTYFNPCTGPDCSTVAVARAAPTYTPTKVCDVLVSNMVDTVNDPNTVAYHVQDSSGPGGDPRGLKIYGSTTLMNTVFNTVIEGNRITLTGITTRDTQGNLELTDHDQYVLPLARTDGPYADVLPAPKEITCADLLNPAVGGLLESARIKIKCIAFVSGGTFTGGGSYTITDGTAYVSVYITNTTTVFGPVPTRLTAAGTDLMDITGIIQKYASTYELLLLHFNGNLPVPNGDIDLPHCDTTIGACCYADSSCRQLTQSLCSTLGGLTFHPESPTCAGVTCPLVLVGACCMPDDSCTDLQSKTDCVAVGGTYRGDGSTCAIQGCNGLLTVAQARALQGQQVTLRDVMINHPKDPNDPNYLVSLNNTPSVVTYNVQDNSGPGGTPVGIDIYGSASTVKPMFSGMDAADRVSITGTVAASDYNGLREISAFAGPFSVNQKYPTPGTLVPTIVTPTDFADGSSTAEGLESTLVTLKCVTFVETGTFAGATNYHVTDGVTTVLLRIAATTQYTIVGKPIPTTAQDITGIFSQYDTSDPRNGGYQILPRVWNDFVPSTCVCQSCGGDFNGNGAVNIDDYLAGIGTFINALLGIGSPPIGGLCMDVNGDTKYDGKDIELFVCRVLANWACVQPPAGTISIVRCDIPPDTCPFFDDPNDPNTANQFCKYEVDDNGTTRAMLAGLNACVPDVLQDTNEFCLYCPTPEGECLANNGTDPDYQVFRWQDGDSGEDCYFVAIRIHLTCYPWIEGNCGQYRFTVVPGPSADCP